MFFPLKVLIAPKMIGYNELLFYLSNIVYFDLERNRFHQGNTFILSTSLFVVLPCDIFCLYIPHTCCFCHNHRCTSIPTTRP